VRIVLGRTARLPAASREDEASGPLPGQGGFDFLGCPLRKRLSGPIGEEERRRAGR
jgi:hypothetical protein